MKITICASVSSTPKIKEISDQLIALGHTTEIPYTSQRIIKGEISLEKFLNEKEASGDAKFRNSGVDFIKRYYDLIKSSDAVLVLNVDKKNIKNYIGGNVFLEMGFAHILEKPIYMYNDLPDMIYADELKAMRPMVIRENLKLIV